MDRPARDVARIAGALAWLYLIASLALVALGWEFEDRAATLATLTSLRLWWLAPVVAIPVAALTLRRRALLVAGLAGAAIFLWLFGGLWMPRRAEAVPGRPTLTVASYNTWVFNQDINAVIATIRDSGADVVGFQEMSPAVAAGIEARLGDAYPYRLLDVENAVISRHPLTRTRSTLSGAWGPTSPPQAYRIDVQGRPITLIVTHHFSAVEASLGLASAGQLARRREQARSVADFARSEVADGRPVILTTDFNATDQNDVYRILTDGGGLRDVWREAGWGPGLTWRTDRPIFGLGPMGWVARIDHVFHSDGWATLDARLGSWDGRSDHRPVVATLELRAVSENALQRP